MKRKLAIAMALSITLLPVAAAQEAQVDKGPGMIKADSSLYGLEIAMDNAAVSIGLSKASDVAQERAAEAKDAADKGNYEAAQRAAKSMSGVAKKVKANETGLEKAEAVLQEVMENAPAEAQKGLQTALDNVRMERERAGIGERPGSTDSDGQQSNSTSGQANRP